MKRDISRCLRSVTNLNRLNPDSLLAQVNEIPDEVLRAKVLEALANPIAGRTLIRLRQRAQKSLAEILAENAILAQAEKIKAERAR